MTAGPAWPSRPPDHLIDLAEWDALPEDSSARYELVDGVMVVAPHPHPRHQALVLELGAQLRDQVPADQVVLTDTEFALDDDGSYRLVATHDRVAALASGATLALP